MDSLLLSFTFPCFKPLLRYSAVDIIAEINSVLVAQHTD